MIIPKSYQELLQGFIGAFLKTTSIKDLQPGSALDSILFESEGLRKTKNLYEFLRKLDSRFNKIDIYAELLKKQSF